MTRTFVEQLGHETISKFARSAPLRLEEGDFLSKKYPLTAIYLYGYAAEMVLKAAYFRNLRFGLIDEIDADTRNRAMARARVNNLMTRDPHDIPGWARLLTWEKRTLHPPAYGPGLENQIIVQALAIYENWRPQMRYRHTTPSAVIVARVRKAASWMIENFSKM
jgi:hypothetical protein